MFKNMLKKASNTLDFPEEVLLNKQIVTIAGRNSIYIQNFKQLKEYSDKTVKIAVHGCILIISGKSLNILLITSDCIHISGFIYQINYYNGEKNE